jgi:hypothetical protein
MRTRREFRPSSIQSAALEARLALTASSGTLGSSVLLQGLTAPANAFGKHKKVAASALVDLAFQSFAQEFDSARSTYVTAVQNRTATAADEMAFVNFTDQLVGLLANQVVNSLLVYTVSTKRGLHSNDPIPVLEQKLINVNDGKAVPRSSGTLDTSLKVSIPPYNASPTTISLDTYAQDNAIASSAVVIQNGVTLIRSGKASGR